MVILTSASPTVRVTLNDLSRLPVERLARLLLERAAEDPMLLTRLHATIEQSTPTVSASATARSRPGPVDVVGDSADDASDRRTDQALHPHRRAGADHRREAARARNLPRGPFTRVPGGVKGRSSR